MTTCRSSRTSLVTVAVTFLELSKDLTTGRSSRTSLMFVAVTG